MSGWWCHWGDGGETGLVGKFLASRLKGNFTSKRMKIEITYKVKPSLNIYIYVYKDILIYSHIEKMKTGFSPHFDFTHWKAEA